MSGRFLVQRKLVGMKIGELSWICKEAGYSQLLNIKGGVWEFLYQDPRGVVLQVGLPFHGQRAAGW